MSFLNREKLQATNWQKREQVRQKIHENYSHTKYQRMTIERLKVSLIPSEPKAIKFIIPDLRKNDKRRRHIS